MRFDENICMNSIQIKIYIKKISSDFMTKYFPSKPNLTRVSTIICFKFNKFNLFLFYFFAPHFPRNKIYIN